MREIEAIIIRTIYSVLPRLQHYMPRPATNDENHINSKCFEILGFDILIDENLKPWLLEINQTPSFSTDTPFDFKLKKDLIADTLNILGLTYERKK